MTPNGLGSTQYTLSISDDQDAPEGTYRVWVGDGRDGATADLETQPGGLLDLDQGELSGMIAEGSNLMVQVMGPLDGDGRLPDDPEIQVGEVLWQMGSDLPAPSEESADDIVGLPTVEQGFTELPVGQVVGGAATEGIDVSQLGVPRAGYLDEQAGEWISGEVEGLEWVPADGSGGSASLRGEGLSQMLSGRYTFTYSAPGWEPAPLLPAGDRGRILLRRR